MTTFNIVRMRVKAGHEDALLELYRSIDLGAFAGLRHLNVVATGEREYVLLGEWASMEALVAAREGMIAVLERSRSLLEDLGEGLGVTDPRSGEAIASRSP